MESKAEYITTGQDPFEELKLYLSPKDAARLINQLRVVWGSGGGWGRVVLPFKRSKMCRPVTEISAGEEEDG